jgi:O-antigen/teichoic acid export membrane protein
VSVATGSPLSTTGADAPEAVVKRAVRGTFAVGMRQAGVLGLTLVGSTVLARLLTPAQFGVYGVVLFLRSFLNAVGDGGLGSSLIRQPEEPEGRDYSAVFSFQFLVMGATSVALLLAAPLIADAYDLPTGGLWLIRLVALSLAFTSLHAVPSAILERRLSFGPLATAGIAEAVVFNVVAVVMAAWGAGIVSFGVALAAQSLAGAVVLVAGARWTTSWAVDWPRVRRHLAFGLAFQGVVFVSLLKDSITPVLIGLFSGASEVGYTRWAQTFAAYAVLALMLFQRICMPLFARLQHDEGQLRRAVINSVWGANALIAPLASLTLVLGPAVTRLVFGDQWLPALPVFYLLWVANLLVPTATPLLALFNAVGRSGTALRFAVIWMVSTWVLGVPLILAFGAVGFGVANVLVQVTNLLLFREAKRHVDIRFLPLALPAWLMAGAVSVAVLLAQYVVPIRNVIVLGLYAAVAMGAYALVAWVRWNGRVRLLWEMARR